LIEAISAGIHHDLGSGSNVDVCVITKDKADMKRNIKIGAKREKAPILYDFPIGNTRFYFHTIYNF